jgi:YidC/Oxa1 family membrane protein insertase
VDKKSLIGLGLIAVIMGVWLWMSGPTKEQIARNKQVKDSIAFVQKQAEEAEKLKIMAQQATMDSVKASNPVVSDSLKAIQQNEQYRDFAMAAKGEEKLIPIENNFIKAYVSTKGGHIAKVELKNYKRYGKKEALVLFDKDSTTFALKLSAYNKTKLFSTDSFYFTSEASATNSTKQISLKLNTAKSGSYIEYVYSLKEDDYLVKCDVRFVNMQDILSPNDDQVQLNWRMQMPSQEKHIVKEKEAATIYYKLMVENEVDNINPMSEDSLQLTESDIKWISFKQQYFNATLIADNAFSKFGSQAKISLRANSADVVKVPSCDLSIPYNHGSNEKFGMQFYFGPNHYNTLKDYNMDLEKIIPTGWSIFSYLNKWLVIPLFNWLGNMNMGLVILILTIIVKIILFPIAYKTYMSGARMRVLKPETDALNEKLGANADPMKKQQEQMSLYRKAGVNPLSGCIPLLLQFPILIALFAFIPAAIELRQKGFLWTDDLSTYDSIITFGNIPFISWAYGDHVSLFAMLMFVSTIIYTYMNSNMMPQQNNQMPGMKFMMYFMPVIFLAVMNKYAAGLSWYYFLANMFTFSQNWIIKKFVSDEKVRAEIDANMKKPAKVSNFQKRLEEMAKQRQQQVKKR